MKTFRLLLLLITMLPFLNDPVFAGTGAIGPHSSGSEVANLTGLERESENQLISPNSQSWKQQVLERRLNRKSERLASRAEKSRADSKLTLGLIASAGSLALTVLAFILIFTPAILLSLLVLAPLAVLGALLGIVLANSVESSYFNVPGEVRIIKILGWLTICIWLALLVMLLAV